MTFPASLPLHTRPTRVAERVDKTPKLAPMRERGARYDGYPLTLGGFIDNKAHTNNIAGDVAKLLDVKIDCADPVFCTGIIVLLGQALSFRFIEVSEFTGLPRTFCKRSIQNLCRAGLVRHRYVVGDLMEEIQKPEAEQNALMVSLCFALYCLAGAGSVVRTKDGLWANPSPYVEKIFKIERVA